MPISWTEKEVYVGNWERGLRVGRGTHWNGKGNLYVGQWRDNKRNGLGSYFFNLPEWRENQHSEFWLKENTENYTGEFVNDHFQGQGTYRWANGHRYEGAFLPATSTASALFTTRKRVQRDNSFGITGILSDDALSRCCTLPVPGRNLPCRQCQTRLNSTGVARRSLRISYGLESTQAEYLRDGLDRANLGTIPLSSLNGGWLNFSSWISLIQRL